MVSLFDVYLLCYRNEKSKIETMLIKRMLKKEEKYHLHLL